MGCDPFVPLEEKNVLWVKIVFLKSFKNQNATLELMTREAVPLGGTCE